jgi:hypothetical protein
MVVWRRRVAGQAAQGGQGCRGRRCRRLSSHNSGAGEGPLQGGGPGGLGARLRAGHIHHFLIVASYPNPGPLLVPVDSWSWSKSMSCCHHWPALHVQSEGSFHPVTTAYTTALRPTGCVGRTRPLCSTRRGLRSGADACIRGIGTADMQLSTTRQLWPRSRCVLPNRRASTLSNGLAHLSKMPNPGLQSLHLPRQQHACPLMHQGCKCATRLKYHPLSQTNDHLLSDGKAVQCAALRWHIGHSQ